MPPRARAGAACKLALLEPIRLNSRVRRPLRKFSRRVAPRAGAAAAGGRRDLSLRARRRRPGRRRRRARGRARRGARRLRCAARPHRARGDARRRRRFRRSRPRSASTVCRLPPFHDLVSAFRQDVTVTRYANFDEVLRLLPPLRQSGRAPAARAVSRADRPPTWRRATPSAPGLQLTNFWQDIAIDWQKDRVYLPQDDLRRFGVSEAQIADGRVDDAWRALLRVRSRARARPARGRAPAHARAAVAPGARAVGDHQRRTAHPRPHRRRRRRRLRAPPRARDRATGSPSRGAPSSRARPARRMTPDEYCQQKAAASGSSFYYSFLFLPPPRRRAITALYAFCREVDDVVDEVSDPHGRDRQARVVAARDRAGLRRPAVASGRARAAADRARIRPAGGALPDGHRRHGDGPGAAPLSRFRRRSNSTATASPASSASCPRRSSATPTRRPRAMRATWASRSS